MKPVTAIKAFEMINGVSQGMFIEYSDLQKPVLLFLHGGPGSPEYSFFQYHQVDLAQLFTVCFWEQRGAGLSFVSKTANQELTIEQMIDDTIAVAEHLKSKYQQEKIYLMGHSWGSFLGALTVSKAPEYFHAYFGVGQIGNQRGSEIEGYELMLARSQAEGNQRLEQKLHRMGPASEVFLSPKYMQLRSKTLNDYGVGMYHKPISTVKMAQIVLFASGYTFSEKLKFVKGMNANMTLFDKVLEIDLSSEIKQLELPVFIFQGIHDYTTSYRQAESFFNQLEAPFKQMISFQHSAHCPPFEETDKFLRELAQALSVVEGGRLEKE